MMYSYGFTLCRRAVVVTMDLSAKNLHMLATDHWLANSTNGVALLLSEPAGESDDAAVTSLGV